MPRPAPDEPALIARIVALATRFGRYGYRRITALLRQEGWRVNHKRVERLWRQEGLRVPAKQPKRGRLRLLADLLMHEPAGDPVQVLSWLHARESVRVRYQDLPEAPGRIERDDLQSSVRGMLLGLAIGDALGNTTESMSPRERAMLVGEIDDYLPNRYAEGKPRGVPSDDTQLAVWAMEVMLEEGAFSPSAFARKLATEQIYGIGPTTAVAQDRLRAGCPWHAAAPAGRGRGAGNGALMRIAPAVLPHLRNPTSALWADVVLNTRVTHNSEAALAASVAFVAMLWDLLEMRRPPPAAWWADRFLTIAKPVEGTQRYGLRGGRWNDDRVTLSEYVERVLPWAREGGLPALDACNAWYSGAYVLETVPSVLYILERHGDDPETAIRRAVNDTRDNDTIAAIVGAAVGALHGSEALPERWREGLLGRTRSSDDGHYFTLVDAAIARFVEGRDP